MVYSMRRRGVSLGTVFMFLSALSIAAISSAQGLGGAGTVQGIVKDPTGGVMQAVEVKIRNPVSGFSRMATTDAVGRYAFSNLPPSHYHLAIEVQGFVTLERDVDVRTAVSYAVPGSGTVLRASYGRTMETPYNENLLLSAGRGLNGLFGDSQPVPPGTRNQGEFGVQQAFGRWVVADFGYFVKRTTNGYDFGMLFNTPIAFPVAWDHSRIDGFTGRVNLVEHRGFSAFVVMAHTNAIYSPPGVGGILLEQPDTDFRIDHDQKFNATTNLQYTFYKPAGAWAALSWRYDSGLVAGSVPDYATALALTGDQQAAIGLFCGGTVATISNPITSCASSNRGATRIVIPADGAEDDVTNPGRVAPRHLFDLGLGVDNLLHTDKAKVRLRFSVINLTNREALYNFLSTFSGTHFVTPRAYQVQLGVSF